LLIYRFFCVQHGYFDIVSIEIDLERVKSKENNDFEFLNGLTFFRTR